MFSRGGDKKEDIAIEALDARLNSYFDEELAGFGKKASRIDNEIEDAVHQFNLACEEFDRVAAEPYMEFISRGNPNYIKSQKAAYVATLKHTLELHNPGADEPNLRARYSAMLSSLESMTDGILKVNGQFKQVVMAYPKYLDGFKRAFPRLERLGANLKRELERTDNELTEFNEVRGHVYNLTALSDEHSTVEEELASQEHWPATKGDAALEIEAAVAKRDGKTRELEAIRKKRDGIVSGITALLIPLGKAARLYDHATASKHKLASVIENPIPALKNNEYYAEFGRQLADLKDKVAMDFVKVKNRDEVLSRVVMVQSYDIYGSISELDLLGKEETSVSAEISVYARAIEEFESETTKSKNRKEELVKLVAMAEELKRSMENEKGLVEQLLLKYYGKTVRVLL